MMIGYSAYPRHFDYVKLRQIADKVGAILVADIAHISGLVATGNAPNVFDHCHVVTTTTHKTLRGPRGAIVWALKNHHGQDLIGAINESTFPGFQGGPHNHTIGAIAVALREASTPAFREYGTQVIRNSRALAEALKRRGYDLFTHGTDNHIVMLNLRNKHIDGGRIETVFNQLDISVNKNTLKGDQSATRPSGVRLGSPAMTSRGFKEKDFEQVAEFLHRGITIALEANNYKKVSEFNAHIQEKGRHDETMAKLREEIREFAESFPFECLPL
jgi:glycine hydroxymethyltransferase